MDHKPDYIFSLGGGLQWCSERRYAREMSLSQNSFRALCRALQVPMIELPGGERIICVPMFTLAFWAISRIGQPDFLMPGCPSIRHSHHERRLSSRSLDLDYLQECLEDCIAEIASARKLKGHETRVEATDVAREAAKRMIEAAVRVQAA